LIVANSGGHRHASSMPAGMSIRASILGAVSCCSSPDRRIVLERHLPLPSNVAKVRLETPADDDRLSSPPTAG